MPSPAEKPPFRGLTYGFLAILALLVGIPGYLTLSPSWRTIAIRALCAIVVITVCVRVVSVVRRTLEDEAPSPLDAPPPPPRSLALDDRFLRLRDDIVFSSANRRYFEVFLWPRLRGLTHGELAEPAVRRRRGPS